MVLTHTIETDGRQAGANQHMVLTHTIQADVFDPYNRNRWPHNSRATAFCHAWPILLFVPGLVVIPLLSYIEILTDKVQTLISFYLLRKLLRYVGIVLLVEFFKHLERFSMISSGVRYL